MFWKQVRGLGLAYSCHMQTLIDQALIQFVVRRSPDCSKAFKQVQSIMEDMAAGKLPFDEGDFLAAKAGVLFSIIEKEDTVSSASLQTFVNQNIKHTTKDGTKRLLERVQNVTIADLQHVLKTRVGRLFEPETSIIAVTSAPAKAAEIVEAFGALNFKLDLVSSVNDLHSKSSN